MGNLLLARNVSKRGAQVLKAADPKQSDSLLQAEEAEFQVTHAEVGGIVLESWQLPESIVSAVLCHHDPERLIPSPFGPSEAVTVANWMVMGARGLSGDLQACDAMSERLGTLWAEETREEWKKLVSQ